MALWVSSVPTITVFLVLPLKYLSAKPVSPQPSPSFAPLPSLPQPGTWRAPCAPAPGSARHTSLAEGSTIVCPSLTGWALFGVHTRTLIQSPKDPKRSALVPVVEGNDAQGDLAAHPKAHGRC